MTGNQPRSHLEAVLLVGIGGFAGSNLRYFVDTVAPASLLATGTVNVLGSLALGLLLYEHVYRGSIAEPTRTFLATGFLASFTTYSTFVLDVLRTTPTVAVGYSIASYALGFLGVLVGREVARRATARVGVESGGRG